MIGMESQVERDAAALAARPRKRPSERADETLPDRTLEQRNADWEQQTKDRHIALAKLRRLASAEREELKGYMARRR